MPTRKELLEQLRDNIGDLSTAVGSGSEALHEQASLQARAAEGLGKQIKEAGRDLVGAAIVGPIAAMVAEATAREVRRINSITEMINSVLLLQAHHDHLSYDFIIERSFVEGAGKEEKQNRLNELILGGAVESEETDSGERFFIDVKNPQLLEWQRKIEALKAGS